MKTYKLTIIVLVIAVALFILLPNLSWAEDTATLFKAKCAGCHGVDGKAATSIAKKMNIKDFSSERVQKATDAELVDFIENGGTAKKPSHAFATKGVTEEQAKALAEYSKILGKK